MGYRIALVFFGFSTLILGYLILKSGYLPKLLGVLMIFASIVYQDPRHVLMKNTHSCR